MLFEKDNQTFIKINLKHFNPIIAFILIFIMTLIIGLYNQTDVYEKLNKLPEDRNETTPIKNIIIHLNDESSLYVRIEFESITEYTKINLFSNLNAHISYDNTIEKVSAPKSSYHSFEENSFLFIYNLPSNITKFSVQIFLFDQAINQVQHFEIKK